MKFHVLSDLHLEHSPFTAQVTDADAVILAGDIGPGTSPIGWAALSFPDRQVIFVPGNHEGYGYEFSAYQQALKMADEQTPSVLVAHGDGQAITLTKEGEPPVRVLATTLWTDFALFGGDKQRYGKATQNALADYRAIRLGDKLLTWEDTAAWHHAAVMWLSQEIAGAKGRGERIVVVSHHAPSLHSSAPYFREDPVTSGFASNLEDLAAGSVDLWIHGHMHNSSDYSLGNCRVVANPRGYPHQRWNPDTRYENAAFNPALVITL